jgi:aminoglycoside phosphotransferase (APT) family kinase protein
VAGRGGVEAGQAGVATAGAGPAGGSAAGSGTVGDGTAGGSATDGGTAAGALTGIQLISGGRSNLTYRLDLGDRMLVLRRPPLGHVLPTAHDMSREYRVLTALSGTAIPVPFPVAFCADPDVVGAPFYLMRYVDGEVLRTSEDGAHLTPGQASQLSERLVEMLAAIHAVDTGAVGLTGFGRPDGYLARQLARWQRQWELSATREMPGYDSLVQRLTAGLPRSAEGTLVHGDYRLDNMLVTMEARPAIAAVVDWEMSTLGDPLADLGLTLMYWSDPGEKDWLGVGATVTSMPGFMRRAEVAARYAELTGRDISGIGYYVAFGCFKLAVVLEGIHARFLKNQTVGEGFEREGPAVPKLIERAHHMLDADPLSPR